MWRRGRKRHILGFRGNEKVNEIPNAIFLFIITAIIANHTVLRILIDDKSSWDVVYIDYSMLSFLRRNLGNGYCMLTTLTSKELMQRIHIHSGTSISRWTTLLSINLSFIDEYSRYNQVTMQGEYKKKTPSWRSEITIITTSHPLDLRMREWHTKERWKKLWRWNRRDTRNLHGWHM